MGDISAIVTDIDAFKHYLQEHLPEHHMVLFKKEYDCYESAIQKFCALHNLDVSEIEHHYKSRYDGKMGMVGYQQPQKLLDGIGVLARLYRGLNLRDIEQYESASKYFLVHESCEAGFFPLIRIDGVDQMVPCLRVAPDTPIEVIEKGGEFNMKRFSKQIYVCIKSSQSQSPLNQLDGEPYSYESPFGIDIPPTDIAFGEKFGIAYCGRDGQIYLSSEKMSFSVKFAQKGEYYLLAQCAKAKTWCYVDVISERRKLLNVLQRSYCGKVSSGYPMTYSITGKVNVFNDLSGVLNRFNLNDSKGVQLEGKIGDLRSVHKLFANGNFDFDKLFGMRFGTETDRRSAPCVHTEIMSKDFTHKYSYHSFCQGFTSVSDIMRGVVNDDKNVVNDIDIADCFPVTVAKDIKRIFESDDIGANLNEYIAIRFGTSSQFTTEGIKNKVILKNEYELTDHECVQMYLKILNLDLFYTKTDLFDRYTNTHYNILFVGSQPLLCAFGTLIFLNVKRFAAFDRSMIKRTFMKDHEGREIPVGYIHDKNYLKILRNNFHITWHRPAKFREFLG